MPPVRVTSPARLAANARKPPRRATPRRRERGSRRRSLSHRGRGSRRRGQSHRGRGSRSRSQSRRGHASRRRNQSHRGRLARRRSGHIARGRPSPAPDGRCPSPYVNELARARASKTRCRQAERPTRMPLAARRHEYAARSRHARRRSPIAAQAERALPTICSSVSSFRLATLALLTRSSDFWHAARPGDASGRWYRA